MVVTRQADLTRRLVINLSSFVLIPIIGLLLLIRHLIMGGPP